MLKTSRSITNIMEKALNSIDSRLMGHGKRVAYLMYKILKPQDLFGEKELHDICILALLHDVGAYKTEEIDEMVIFETTEVWEHSIYGYMFLKYLSPLSSWSPVILYHHVYNEMVKWLGDSKHEFLAQLLFLCDRADIQSLQDDSNQEFIRYVNNNREIKYSDDVVEMYLEAKINIDTIFEEMQSDGDFEHFLYHTPIDSETTNWYLLMILYTIHFKSEVKVNQAYASTYIPSTFTRFSSLPEAQIKKIIENTFIEELEGIGVCKKVVKSAKQMNIANRKIDNYNFLEDILMIAELFVSIYGSTGYKDSNPKTMVVDILSDLIVRQGLKTNVVALVIEEYDNIAQKCRRVRPSALEIYKTVEKIAEG